MTTKQMKEKEGRRHNSTYPKVAVQWLNQALCFYSNSVLRIKFSAEKPAHCQSAKR
jgi:hypothetical protein